MKIETLLHNDIYMISDSIMVCANVKKNTTVYIQKVRKINNTFRSEKSQH